MDFQYTFLLQSLKDKIYKLNIYVITIHTKQMTFKGKFKWLLKGSLGFSLLHYFLNFIIPLVVGVTLHKLIIHWYYINLEFEHP